MERIVDKPLPFPYVVLSYINGCYDALCAVLEFCEHRGMERIVSLGNLIGTGPDPRECIAASKGFTCSLQSKRDSCYVPVGGHAFSTDPGAARIMKWTADVLSSADREYLATSPSCVRWPNVAVCSDNVGADLPGNVVFRIYTGMGGIGPGLMNRSGDWKSDIDEDFVSWNDVTGNTVYPGHLHFRFRMGTARFCVATELGIEFRALEYDADPIFEKLRQFGCCDEDYLTFLRERVAGAQGRRRKRGGLLRRLWRRPLADGNQRA